MTNESICAFIRWLFPWVSEFQAGAMYGHLTGSVVTAALAFIYVRGQLSLPPGEREWDDR